MGMSDNYDYDYDYEDQYDHQFINVIVEVTGETPKAFQCRMEDGTKFWIAKSLIELSSNVFRQGDRGRLCIPLWKAKELNLD